jgi:hypothetical protein
MAGQATTARKAKPTPKRESVGATVTPAVPRGTKTYKFATITAEAKARMDERAAERAKHPIPPFVMDDVTPPIVITAPDTQERILVSAEGFSLVQRGDMGAVMPLLRALCGDAFDRVWWLVKDDKGTDRTIALLNALSEHFDEVLAPYMEANDLPGGSQGSSD